MKKIVHYYVTKALLDKYDISGVNYGDILCLDSDKFDRVIHESYVSKFDEYGDSCDDDSLMVIESRVYYDRDLRDDYKSPLFCYIYSDACFKESEVI